MPGSMPPFSTEYFARLGVRAIMSAGTFQRGQG